MRRKFWLKSLRGRDHSKEVHVDENMLKCVLNGVWDCGLDSSGSGHGPVTVSCEHGNETSGSVLDGKFID